MAGRKHSPRHAENVAKWAATHPAEIEERNMAGPGETKAQARRRSRTFKAILKGKAPKRESADPSSPSPERAKEWERRRIERAIAREKRRERWWRKNRPHLKFVPKPIK